MANKESLLLNQEQEAYLAWLITPDDSKNPSTKKAYAEKAEVHLNTLGYWEKKKNFIERWKLAIEGRNQSPERSGKLLEVLYIKGLAGDLKAAELFLKATGQMPNASQTLNIKTESSVKDLSDEDLQAMILEIAGNKKKAPPMPTMSLEKIGDE